MLMRHLSGIQAIASNAINRLSTDRIVALVHSTLQYRRC